MTVSDNGNSCAYNFDDNSDNLLGTLLTVYGFSATILNYSLLYKQIKNPNFRILSSDHSSLQMYQVSEQKIKAKK